MVRFKAWTTNLTLGLHVADSSMRSSWSPGRRVTEQLVAHVAELIVAVLVPHSLKENVEVANLAHHVQVSERVCELTTQVSASTSCQKVCRTRCFFEASETCLLRSQSGLLT